MSNTDLNTLIEMNNKMNSPEIQEAARVVEIHNPAQTIEDSLVSYVTARFNRLEQDADFVDLIRMAIRARIPEFTPDQLITLLNNTSNANNTAIDNFMKSFRNETSGKTLIEHVRDNDVSSTAAQLYNSIDSRDILQSLTYFTQVVSSGAFKGTIKGEAEPVESN